jgi:hypothetical protein
LKPSDRIVGQSRLPFTRAGMAICSFQEPQGPCVPGASHYGLALPLYMPGKSASRAKHEWTSHQIQTGNL